MDLISYVNICHGVGGGSHASKGHAVTFVFAGVHVCAVILR